MLFLLKPIFVWPFDWFGLYKIEVYVGNKEKLNHSYCLSVCGSKKTHRNLIFYESENSTFYLPVLACKNEFLSKYYSRT